MIIIENFKQYEKINCTHMVTHVCETTYRELHSKYLCEFRNDNFNWQKWKE